MTDRISGGNSGKLLSKLDWALGELAIAKTQRLKASGDQSYISQVHTIKRMLISGSKRTPKMSRNSDFAFVLPLKI